MSHSFPHFSCRARLSAIIITRVCFSTIFACVILCFREIMSRSTRTHQGLLLKAKYTFSSENLLSVSVIIESQTLPRTGIFRGGSFVCYSRTVVLYYKVCVGNRLAGVSSTETLRLQEDDRGSVCLSSFDLRILPKLR